MGLRHMHPVRDQAHDDRRGWRREAGLQRDLADARLRQEAARLKIERLLAVVAELAAENVVLRSALASARSVEHRRATA